MKVTYTAAAEQELVAFQQKQKALLEELVSERKFVFGDDVVEITASDIKLHGGRIRAIRSTGNKSESIRMMAQLYGFFGVLIMVAAIFYPRLQTMFEMNPFQGIFFSLGAALTVVGIAGTYVYRLRLRRIAEVERTLRHSTQTKI